MLKYFSRRNTGSLNEKIFNEDALKFLQELDPVLIELERSTQEIPKVNNFVKDLQNYTIILKKFLENRKPGEDDIAELKKAGDKLTEYMKNDSTPEIKSIVDCINSMPLTLTNHPTKTQRLFQATMGLALAAVATTVAVVAIGTALSLSVPTLCTSWFVIPPAIEMGVYGVLKGLEMVGGAITNTKTRDSVNELVTNLKSLSKIAEKSIPHTSTNVRKF